MREHLEAFLRKRGLESEDVAKVTATFVASKYATWVAFGALGIRYQPLSRLFRRHASLRDRVRHRLQRMPQVQRPWLESWRSKAAVWYQEKSAKFADRFAENRMWASMSRMFSQDPRRLALGLAEGWILYKVTLPVHVPLVLFLVIQYYRRTPSMSVEDMAELRGIALEDDEEEQDQLQHART